MGLAEKGPGVSESKESVKKKILHPYLNQKAFEAGAVACFTKPYRQGTLVNCADMALASGARARQWVG